MGIFTKDFARQALGKIQEKRAMQATVRNNPNATAKDYLQAGMSSFSMMAAKAKAAQAAKAPLATGFGTAVDRLAGSSTRNQMQQGALGQSGFAGMVNNAMANRAAAPISAMQPTAISPTAFTNQNAITGMFGAENPGTFTRTVGDTPLAQMDDTSMMGADMPLDEYGQAQMPPMEVETPITPTYDLNNL